ncbi:hypothetical protein Pcinc_039744 [Petrolisthes cinctipes]|uniref:Longin domain-containing protein n=1 Tax=Petrolisthes cinctipes TaxID=88211 RepID=A0AAE1EK91_PETCI|nr:hypothetical protein Pcinc_039744 [Petrolisthes cinctipes]
MYRSEILEMIVYACLNRLTDGTPLSATTDISSDADKRVHEGKRCIKLLSKQLAKYKKRICLQAEDITVHGVMDECTGYLVVCEPNYPHILAFSFLDELMKEFSILYTSSVVKSVRRPYAFIEFDSFLQKTRQKYNSSRALASRINLAEMTNDLNLHPPTYLKMHQLEPPPAPPPLTPSVSTSTTLTLSHRHDSLPHTLNNGVLANGTISKDAPSIGVILKLKPVPWYGWLALILVVPCMLLDLYRGVVALSMASLEGLDGPSPWHGIFFLAELLLQITQVHLLWRYKKFRKLGTLGCTVFILILCGFLLDVREGWLCILYILVSILMSMATYGRPFEKKLPRFHI